MQHYTRGRCGEWAHLFRHGDGYLGTALLERSDDSREYPTLDRSASRDAYDEAFQARFSSEYRWLHCRLEELTEEEALVGVFEALPKGASDPPAKTPGNPSSWLYSPKCVEQEFCEVHIQDAELIPGIPEPSRP
jgi:hypothetical protein